MGFSAVVDNPLALALLEDLGWLAGILELDDHPPSVLQKPVIRGTFASRIRHLSSQPAIGFSPGDDGPLNSGLGHQVTMA